MNDTEKVVEHLKMIQAAIDHLGRNSLWIKTWSLSLIVAALILIAIHYVHRPHFSLILIPFVLAFWILDGYISSGVKDCFEKYTTTLESNPTPTFRWTFSNIEMNQNVAGHRLSFPSRS